MKTPLLLILSFFLLQSCNGLMMKMYGIKDPEIENEHSILQQALEFNLDTSNIVSVYNHSSTAKYTGQGIPNASIYSGNGKYIEYRQTDTSCNAGLFQFIPDLNPANTYHMPDSTDLNGEWIKFRDLKGNKLSEPEPADFYVLIYWAVWTGKLNKDHVKVWEDLAKNNKNCNVKVIKVNLDLQEYWGLTDDEKMDVHIKKKR